MKRPITATGLLTLLAMIVVGVFSTGSAIASGGPNSVFLWTGPLPGFVLGLSDNPQVFSAAPGFEFECKHLRGHGRISNGVAMTAKDITLIGVYSECIALPTGLNATVTTAEFLLNADGSVGIVGKPIVITIPEANCSLKIESGAPNNNLRLILFLNLKEDILAHVEIGGIASLSSGEPCGAANTVKPGGTYRGLFLLFVDGGTLRWDK